MTTIRTLIVDDESLARRGLALRLKQHPDIEILAQCSNGREALSAIEQYSPDLVFLDIQMPGIDGFEVVRKIQADNMPLIVFVTAFDQYAVDAFEIHAVDYVLKPIEDDRLSTAIERVRFHRQQTGENDHKKRLMDLITNITGESAEKIDKMLADGDLSGKKYPEKIAIKDRGETTLVPTKDIAWVDAAGDYMCLHTGEAVHVLRSTMKNLEEKLDPHNFQRVHRSTIVNLDKIEKVCSHINGEYHLILQGGSRLKMSRSYREKIKHIV